MHREWFTHPLLFPRWQQGADKWIALAFTQMLTFRQGHENGERQSDQVAGGESFCSPWMFIVECVVKGYSITGPWEDGTSHLSVYLLGSCWWVSLLLFAPPLGLSLGMSQPVKVCECWLSKLTSLRVAFWHSWWNLICRKQTFKIRKSSLNCHLSLLLYRL